MPTEGIKSFSNGYGVVVWTDENGTKTISVDANLFENEAKQVMGREFNNNSYRETHLYLYASCVLWQWK